jgi:hypothetical protein
MYNIQLAGTAGPEADISKVRVYIAGAMTEAAVSAGAAFTVTVQHPDAGAVTLEHSFVDAAGNESGRFGQQLVIPDKAAPAMPSVALSLVSVVWAA